MGRLIDESLLQEKLALIPMEERTFRRTVEELENAPTVEAIPKAEVKKFLEEGTKDVSNKVLAIVREDYIHKSIYEARLKADMVAMLEDLDLQIDELAAYNREYAKIQRLIRDRIDKLKENKDAI